MPVNGDIGRMGSNRLYGSYCSNTPLVACAPYAPFCTVNADYVQLRMMVNIWMPIMRRFAPLMPIMFNADYVQLPMMVNIWMPIMRRCEYVLDSRPKAYLLYFSLSEFCV